jgi:hypothetical protein
MKAKAWNNGRHHPSGAGYGVKLSAGDRDRWFQKDWAAIRIQVPGEGTTEVPCRSRSGGGAPSCAVLRSVAGCGVVGWRRGPRGSRRL